MASQDVIELGSSEDEAEPSVKKMKPVPNAMVHIPRNIPGANIQCVKMTNVKLPIVKMPNVKLPNVKMPNVRLPNVKMPNVRLPNVKIPGVTIKPAKSNIASNISKQLSGKNVTITKIPKGMKCSNNPYNINKIVKVKPVQKTTILQPSSVVIQKKNLINPLNVMGKLTSQVAINKVPGTPQNSIRIQSHKTINNLPPCVTVKRSIPNMKRVAADVRNSVQKKMKLNVASEISLRKVLTVELDDEDMSNTTSASPQWYIRPEDDAATKMEEENNKEPDMTQMVEITIEDSPIKPPCIKKTSEVCTELSVIIEDSPVKSKIVDKTSSSNGDCNTHLTGKVPHSKKKLEYPKDIQSDTEKIEIEISPIVHGKNLNTAEDKINTDLDTIIEIEESPLKLDEPITSTPKKEQRKPQLETAKSLVQLQEDDGLSEFNPIYREFIKLCFQLENSEDMKKIVEKKIKTYYRQVPKEYTDSECFIDMVSSKILAMKAGPEKMYLYIKDVVDDLNWQRKLAKSQILTDIQEKVAETRNNEQANEPEYDSKRQRQIRKLEKTLKKLHRAIQKLETQEVDFDDDEDSVYLLTERYKERLVKVHAKFCQLTNTKMPSEPHVQIDERPGRPAGPAKRIEKWINKKVPIGAPLPFPDFHDVLRCVREANQEDHLGWNEVDIMEEARDLFTRCGKKLQRRRQENEWRLAASRISTEGDPAEKSEELRQQLADNMSLAAKKETEVLNKYADRQSQLKLEAEEIGDKEAEESPVESDEEEPIVESPLVNKEERKKRLKRLLEEKSSKAIEGEDSLVKTKQQDIAGKLENENLNTDDADKQPDDTIKTDNEKQDISKDNVGVVQNDVNNQSSNNKDHKSIDQEEIHSLSDDSKNLESDIDELHLLQKLYSENEAPTSSQEISDSDSPIAISDTLGSSTEDKNPESDVISIENSTYSESEIKNDENDNNDVKISSSSNLKAVDAHVDFEIECSTDGVHKKVIMTNNDEYNESIEDILLASTDDEGENDDCQSKKLDNTIVPSNIQNGSTIDCNDTQEDSTSKDSVTIISEECDDENESSNAETHIKGTKVCDKHILHGSSNDVQDNDSLNSKLLEVPGPDKNVKKTVVTEIDDINKQTMDDIPNESSCNLSSKLDLECKSNKENIKLDSHD